MKPTLVILAAGIGSRYGSLKQMDAVGPSGETIIDYSIYDALRAGFGNAVFIIRRGIEADFREAFLKKLHGRVEVDYVFQELDDLPPGFRVPPHRHKPWGTSHAVLMAAAKVRKPFAVINADDFYGRDAYRLMGTFLAEPSAEPGRFAVVGYDLQGTLSEHGSVARGVCEVDGSGYLKDIVERTHIEKTTAGIASVEADGGSLIFPSETVVSMNFWGFTPAYFDLARREFERFLRHQIDNPKAEMFIPLVVNTLIQKGEATVKVLPTSSTWFGVTYREDKPRVMAEIKKLIDAGEYPETLWA